MSHLLQARACSGHLGAWRKGLEGGCVLRVRHISPRACVFLRAHHEHASAGTQHVRPCTSHTRPRASVLDGAHTALHRPPGGCPHIRGPLSRHVHVSTRMAEQVTLPGLCLPSCGQAVHTGLTLRGCAYVCPHPHPCTRGCSVRAEPTAQQRRLQPGLKIHHKLSLQHPRHLADWASAPPRPAQMPEGTTPASRSATTAAPATALSLRDPRSQRARPSHSLKALKTAPTGAQTQV